MTKRVTTQSIVEATGLSRATVDRVLNNRHGVHPRTCAVVRQAIEQLHHTTANASPASGYASSVPKRQFYLIVQAGDAFTLKLGHEVKRAAALDANKHHQFDVFNFSIDTGDAALIHHLRAIPADVDSIAVIVKNTPAISYELAQLRSRGTPVVAMVSDVDPAARDCYVGIDNRAAGQAVGHLIGQHFRSAMAANVAVVVGSFSFICHEDRETGFRSVLRANYPHVKIVDVIKGNDTAEATYRASKMLLKQNTAIDGIYNVGGGNNGLGLALTEAGRQQTTLFVAHEVNLITERLLRDGVIDYVVSQDMEKLVGTTVDQLLRLASGLVGQENSLIPSFMLCKYMLP